MITYHETIYLCIYYTIICNFIWLHIYSLLSRENCNILLTSYCTWAHWLLYIYNAYLSLLNALVVLFLFNIFTEKSHKEEEQKYIWLFTLLHNSAACSVICCVNKINEAKSISIMEAAAVAVAAGTVRSRATLLQHWLSLALCGVFFMLHLLHTQRSLHYSELSTTCKAHTHTLACM